VIENCYFEGTANSATGVCAKCGQTGTNSNMSAAAPSTNLQNKVNDLLLNKKIVKGATGMYTGEWGSEGKLAILHEKELVLNKEDTANMLAAVGMIR
jgi:hypothetical protein